MTQTTETASVREALLRIRGTVQGVGFRPFVFRIATRLGVRGWVRNDSDGVIVRIKASPDLIDEFSRELARGAPSASFIDGVEEIAGAPDTPPVGDGFEIFESDLSTVGITTAIPADLAICADCQRELLSAGDRRRGYPFINCTQCGPRYAIIESLPYDRSRTTMRAFPMCPACRKEYGDPSSRRYHAEPNACAVCGPSLSLFDSKGLVLATRDDALLRAVSSIANGSIVAVKGVGGFHLFCDATNDAAVSELRRRKHREEKPFAVMFRDVEALRQHADASLAEEALLRSSSAPIVLVRRRAGGNLSAAIAPGNPWLGAILPYTPLHVLLMRALDRPLIATSANLSEEPLCTEEADALRRLEGIADLFLCHDRVIVRPVDDSVLRMDSGGDPVVLRRSRGYAPSPFTLPGEIEGSLLCAGAQMKSTVAIALGNRVVLSPHIGDLGNAATQQAYERSIEMMAQLCGSRIERSACDKHPDYNSTRHAGRSGLPVIAVQHHLAHLLACLLENKQPAQDVLGVVWDGNGYGEDGTAWGGEFLLADKGRVCRFAHLRRFRLAGGDAAARDARRLALALLHECVSSEFGKRAAAFGFSDNELATLAAMLARGINSPLCSSAGRLFDAAGFLLGLGRRNAFEGQLPLAVEAAASLANRDDDPMPFILRASQAGAVWEIDWEPALWQLLEAKAESSSAAFAFHLGLARSIAEVARRAGVGTVALSGGCFQNVLLLDLTRTALQRDGFKVLTHRQLPPGDGSIAAGQALAALWNITTVGNP
ncbi:MAG: carbamoyltransferase HypF [Opitutaceae bacterium]|jgi:hydrogenase maturation protein HypF